MNSTETGHRYDTVVVRDNAAAHLGDLHVHVHIDQINHLQELLYSFESKSHPRADYDRSILFLNDISSILWQIERLDANAHLDDGPLLENLRFTISTTLDTVRKQTRTLEQLTKDTKVAFPDPGNSSLGHSNQVLSADDVARSLHHHLNNQLLLLNTTLQVLHKKAEHRKAHLQSWHQNDLLQRADTQIRQIEELQLAMQSSVSVAQKSRKMLERLVDQSLQQVKAFSTMQNAILRTPALAENDSILFLDALRRRFKLPYVDYISFEVFEAFLKHQFQPATIPGGTSVAAGRYLIANQNNSMQVATKDNWASIAYPGCKLVMSVILNMLSMSILKCPRPGCGEITNSDFESGKFITCWKCKLRYRFDRTIFVPSAAKCEENLMLRQLERDRAEFGDMNRPQEVVFEEDVTDRALNTAPVVLVNDSYKQFGNITSPSTLIPVGYDQGESHTTNRFSYSIGARAANVAQTRLGWEDASAVETWRDNVVMPTSVIQPVPYDDATVEARERERELQDLESLHNVHFVELQTTNEALARSIPTFTGMSLETQIHYRKIIDNFPGISVVLAERLARTNAERSHRLEGIKNDNETKAMEALPRKKAPVSLHLEHQSKKARRKQHVVDGADGLRRTSPLKSLQKQGQGVIKFFWRREREKEAL